LISATSNIDMLEPCKASHLTNDIWGHISTDEDQQKTKRVDFLSQSY
jgi:hypothetical protein